MKDYNTRLEEAAREICILRGIDPEERVLMPKSDIRTLNATYGPCWKLAAREIEAAVERVRIKEVIHKHNLMFKGD